MYPMMVSFLPLFHITLQEMSDHVTQSASYIIRALDRMDRALTAASPIAVAMIGVSSMYYVAFSYGLAVVGLLFGRERAGQVSYTEVLASQPSYAHKKALNYISYTLYCTCMTMGGYERLILCHLVFCTNASMAVHVLRVTRSQ